MFKKQLWQFRDNYADGETVSSSTSPQAAPNFAQPNLILISLLFCSKLKKEKKKKTTTNYHLVEKQTHHLNSQVQHWISPCLLGFWTLWLLCHFPIYIPFFVKSDPPVWFCCFFAWKGTECHKLPFPVISNLRWKTHWVAHRLLTSRHTHFQSTVFLCEQFKLHSYLSLENGFLYIFLVCQCLGVLLFFVLWNHFDILKLSAFSITFVELK